jgi:two-component system cell cycle sensor histidine kinase/response regulator CckA
MNKPLQILIVEDSEDDVQLLLRVLRQGGYNPIYERVDTPEAMKSALENQTWQVVISDYLMPRFDAPSALKLLKEKALDIPFIIVSGAIGEETAVTAMKAGAHDYIMKYNLTRLIPVIERELREAEGRKQRKRAEEEKERIEAQLLQAQKMEAIGRLTGGIAHDFNNLLTAIHGCAHLAVSETPVGTKLHNDLLEIQTAAERAMNLTRQLLLFSRRQPMKLVPFNINHAIESLSGMLHRIIGEDITVDYELSPESLYVCADQTSIEQLIVNLVVNARDAMTEGGRITIKMEKAILNKQIADTMTDAREGEFARFSVVDTGMGMDEETQKHIFEPFFSTKEAGKGSGLGLSVVYGIIQQHKGWAHVISNVSKGTTFEVYFPLAAAQPEKTAPVKIPSDVYRGNGERILLIEDEANIRRFAEKALTRSGYAVITASDKNDALEAFEKEGGNFDLIFSDVVLPSTNGVTLIEHFLSIKPDLKVLLSSGYIDQKSQWETIRKKGIPFLQKPYAFEILLKTIKDILSKSNEASR